MGTNYYLYQSPPCECCGRGDWGIHIGKSSAGWCFSLHVQPYDEVNPIHDLPDYEKLWNQPGAVIYNEYGDEISAEEMRDTITNRGWKDGSNVLPPGYANWADFHRSNHSQPGPNGLLRHKIDGFHCIGHGDGTWDLIVGEFS